ncbi:unnamed protein product [Allacma fusca]|uniref:Uncharacterized protein n=1 Tax=Allacma fusca TaxID=39272 RepID=A0A8J2P3I1_9HEXA|nr:unnamed protein product [Allacma fusca]
MVIATRGNLRGKKYYSYFKKYFSRSILVAIENLLEEETLVRKNREFRNVQPIAVFASRGATSGHILSKLLVTPVLKLETAGLEIIASSVMGQLRIRLCGLSME